MPNVDTADNFLSEPTTELVYATLRASDAVDFNRQMSSVGWDLEFLSLEQKPSPLTLSAARTENFAIQRAFFEGRLHQMGASPRGFLTIGLQTQCNNRLKFGNRDCGPDDLLNFNSDVGLDAVTERGHHAFTISISQEKLESCIDVQELRGAQVKDFRYNPSTSVHPQAHLDLQQAIGNLLQLAQTGDEKTFISLEADVTGLFLDTWFDTSKTTPYRYAGASRRLRRVITYINDNLHQPPPINTLCQACAIGRKTLERDFRSHLGVSPRQYINQLRLSAVRKELLQRAPDASIQATASQWGFTHMGKFAADYKIAFGELPSASID